MKVSIVIPWYNTDWLTEKNLPLVLKASKNPKNNILEVVIVDDGSTDKSAAIIKSLFPGIRLIRHKVNRGFSVAVNTGVRSAKGELICLINSDVAPEEKFLESIHSHFRNPKTFAVSLNETGSLGWAKGYFRNGFIEHESGGKGSTPHLTFWVSGGSGVFKRKIWMELGGMDEKLLSPFYWEDLDISYRAMKRGYQLIWDPKAVVVHKHETTMKTLAQNYLQRIRERNQLLVTWKNIGSQNLIRKNIAGVAKRVLSHPGYLRIVVMALAKIVVVLKARAKERKETKVSDEAVFAKFK